MDELVGLGPPRFRGGGVWCGGGVENVEWGVDEGDGWRLLCGGSNVGVGNEPSDGALGVVYGANSSAYMPHKHNKSQPT